MPPKRNQIRSKSKNRPIQKPNALEGCIFPPNVIVGILKHLPVKSIVRFKCVCKPWLKLFLTQKFIKIHYDELLHNPANEAFMIYSLSASQGHTLSLASLAASDALPVNLVHPYPENLKMDFVGCCNGLVCMACPPLGQEIVLWNPALHMYKVIRLPMMNFGVPELVSLGFGYDVGQDDYKVVRVVCLEDKKGKSMRVHIEVYSANSDSWKTVKVGFKFRVLWPKNDVIVNGNPYWVAMVDESSGIENDAGQVLVCFDVVKMGFKIVPLSTLNLAESSEVPLVLVNWNGRLGALACPNEHPTKFMYVLLFNDVDQIWELRYAYGVIQINVERLLQCSNTGKILGECADGKLFSYNIKTGDMKMIVIDEAQSSTFQVHEYTESLVCIKGMEKVVVRSGEGETRNGVYPGTTDLANDFNSYLQGREDLGTHPLFSICREPDLGNILYDS